MLRNPVLGWATIATSAVPPAELAMVSTWHGGRQGGNLNKELEFRSGIVEGKGGTEEFDFRSCHCGRQE